MNTFDDLRVKVNPTKVGKALQVLDGVLLSDGLVNVRQNGKTYKRISVRRHSAGYFMSTIKEYIVLSYMYKVKMPKELVPSW